MFQPVTPTGAVGGVTVIDPACSSSTLRTSLASLSAPVPLTQEMLTKYAPAVCVPDPTAICGLAGFLTGALTTPTPLRNSALFAACAASAYAAAVPLYLSFS